MAFRTKKISQMDPKGAPLSSTDLLEISELVSGSYVTKSITGQEIIDSVPPTSVEWGDIGGTLSAQTDLQSALNAKQDTLVSGTNIKTINSTSLLGSGNVAVQPTLVSGTNIKTINSTSLLGAGDISVGTVTSVSGTAPIASTGGATPTISIATANTTTTGALTSTDWNTFNGKQSALVSGTNIKTINGNTILGSGDLTISVATPTIDQVTTAGSTTTNRITIGGATTNGSVTASGAIARGNYFNNTLVAAANSDTLIGLDIAPTFTNGAFTGVSNIGVFLRSGKFVINSSTSSFASGNLEIYNNASLYSPMVIQQAPTAFRGLTVGTGNHFIFGFGGISASSPLANKCLLMSIGASDILITQGGSSSPTAAEVTMQMFGATKNIGINTTTDAGYKLDVNGTARVQGKLSVNTPTATSAVMEVTSTTQGFLPPRMTTTQKNAISSPAAGLVVYDTTLAKLCVYTTAWETITSI